MSKILVVEDDHAISRGIVDNLEIEGYHVVSAYDGETGLEKGVTEKPDLILLDLMLPKINGYEVLKELRRLNITIPILMVTAKGEEFDRCLGLELGADDYIVKPFSIKELMARVAAHLRRASHFQTCKVIRFDHIEADFARCRLLVDGSEEMVTQTELMVLRFLYERKGNVVTREQLLDGIWGHDYYGTARTIDNFILSLRQKIEKNPKKPTHIKTVRGMGYILDLS
ncbi:MAG: response regulator transcription factor [Candidatus Altiarchaeota archaeon]